MRRRGERWTALGIFVGVMAGCGSQGGAGASTSSTGGTSASSQPANPGVLPTPPLTIAEPDRPADAGDILSGEASPEELARQLVTKGDYAGAVRQQYRAVSKDGKGRYNLACYLAQAGEVDASFYWLQQAARDEGVDAPWAEQDDDLARLRGDPRWGQISPFLAACNAYWRTSGKAMVALTVPTGYRPGTPIPAAIYLHGKGANPEEVAGPLYQRLADELNLAIVGVSGTRPCGRRSFVWSEDAEADDRQIQAALGSLAGELTVQPGSLVTFGFSQGGQMAFEVAFRHPERYRGAIVMSPGTTKTVDLGGLAAAPGNRAQGFVLRCGGQEHPGNLANTQADAWCARDVGARVDMLLYEGISAHSLPPDFGDAFAGWVRFIRGDANSSLTAPLPPAPPPLAGPPTAESPFGAPPLVGQSREAPQSAREAMERARLMHEQRMQEMRQRMEERHRQFRGRHGFGP